MISYPLGSYSKLCFFLLGAPATPPLTTSSSRSGYMHARIHLVFSPRSAALIVSCPHVCPLVALFSCLISAPLSIRPRIVQNDVAAPQCHRHRGDLSAASMPSPLRRRPHPVRLRPLLRLHPLVHSVRPEVVFISAFASYHDAKGRCSVSRCYVVTRGQQESVLRDNHLDRY
ncbi:hypothetical protein BV20DRAFT_698912 [Pilatotrama ljubarskyi]|nr:hypothetical protein BV20DRAFT_698912 [Pilatotrama ljubarskyi]